MILETGLKDKCNAHPQKTIHLPSTASTKVGNSSSREDVSGSGIAEVEGSALESYGEVEGEKIETNCALVEWMCSYDNVTFDFCMNLFSPSKSNTADLLLLSDHDEILTWSDHYDEQLLGTFSTESKQEKEHDKCLETTDVIDSISEYYSDIFKWYNDCESMSIRYLSVSENSQHVPIKAPETEITLEHVSQSSEEHLVVVQWVDAYEDFMQLVCMNKKAKKNKPAKQRKKAKKTNNNRTEQGEQKTYPMFSIPKLKEVVTVSSKQTNNNIDNTLTNTSACHNAKSNPVPNRSVHLKELNKNPKNDGQLPFARRGSLSSQSGGTGTAGKITDQTSSSQTKINQVYKPTGHISRSQTSTKVEEVRLRARASLKSPRRSPSPEKRASKICKSSGKKNQQSNSTVSFVTKL